MSQSHSNYLDSMYSGSLALLTDFYQLTMAYGYWQGGRADQEAVFHLSYRRNPFHGGYALSAGLESAIEWMKRFRFRKDDIEYLATLRGSDGALLFNREFLDYLGQMKFTCDIDAIPEGTVVFPHEPLVRVKGPILQCQILETPLLNLINFQTLIATKAARVTYAAGGDSVLEFGLRRAQGMDGGLSASRAAYLGGCDATSNALAGKVFGIPVRGTHAHSWVMSYEDELEAFKAYAEAMPNNAVFLVDTYQTIEGVKKACEIGKWLRKVGQKFIGIRLDSGDLAYLSQEARKLLDEAGFPEAQILASNDLDEELILSLKEQGAKVSVWGVGTHLVTGHGQSALGGVYKLSSLKEDSGKWIPKVKLSEQSIKISDPGILQVRRFFNDQGFLSDMIFDQTQSLEPPTRVIVDPEDFTRRRELPKELSYEDLLVPIFRKGVCVYQAPELAQVRNRAFSQLKMLHSGIKRFRNPHRYPVGLESRLSQLKTELIFKHRGYSEQITSGVKK